MLKAVRVITALPAQGTGARLVTLAANGTFSLPSQAQDRCLHLKANASGDWAACCVAVNLLDLDPQGR